VKILLLSMYYYPKPKSVATQMYDLAQALVTQQHDVTVVTTTENQKEKIKITKENLIEVIRIKTKTFAKINRFKRLLREIRLSKLIWKNCKIFFKKNHYDLIIFYSPPIFFSSLVKKLKKLWKAKVYLILRDLFPQWSVDIGLISQHGLAYKFLHHFEKNQYAVSDIIGVQSEHNLHYFSEKKLKIQAKLEILHNWKQIDNLQIQPIYLRKKLGLTDKIVFVYSGNIGVAQDMPNIIRLAEKFTNITNIHFLLLGDGDELSNVKQIIMQKQLTNISIHPPLKPKEYLSALSEFDVGMISLSKHLKTHNFPGKMLDYMCIKKPILASINVGNDLRQCIENGNAGLVSINGDDDLLFKNANRLIANSNLRKTMGKNGFNLLNDKFSAMQIAKQIAKHLN